VLDKKELSTSEIRGRRPAALTVSSLIMGFPPPTSYSGNIVLYNCLINGSARNWISCGLALQGNTFSDNKSFSPARRSSRNDYGISVNGRVHGCTDVNEGDALSGDSRCSQLEVTSQKASERRTKAGNEGGAARS
jgi:hypothetical protein